MRDPLDRYMTPASVAGYVVEALAVPSDCTILEPGVGRGVWLDELKRHGHQGRTIAYDVWPEAPGLAKATEAHVGSFLEATTPADLVLGNPPFSQALEFIEHGLTLAPRVALLLRGSFVETTSARAGFWRHHPCVAEWTIGDRLRFANHDGDLPKGSDSMCHSMFFFERGDRSPYGASWPRCIVSPLRGWGAPASPWPWRWRP